MTCGLIRVSPFTKGYFLDYIELAEQMEHYNSKINNLQ